MHRYVYLLCLSWVLGASTVSGQVPAKDLDPSSLSEDRLALLNREFGNRKEIPSLYRRQILLALSYFPELKEVSICFHVRQTNKAPLTTAPELFSILQPGRERSYRITIRNLKSKNLQPILFENLPFNAQVGVIGHELSHVADFHRQSSFQLISSGLKHISYKYLDRFEYRTDSICVAHGLGYQLLAWSNYVRSSLHRRNWIGAGNLSETATGRERYMNPSTIERKIREEAIYRGL
ncbi:MAG TPA: hypothetical protein VHK91_11820 [Flavisolibacter sp.]|jgi:hypothetical protein|nr:hypothetical protein [Flavisolibacter sp.]